VSAGPHWSERFQRRVWLTDHALTRAAERKIPIETLLNVIETGTLRESGQGHCWIWKAVEGRDDNLLCVAALLADVLIVKTVMHRFAPEDT
jgi:hypothetical protein